MVSLNLVFLLLIPFVNLQETNEQLTDSLDTADVEDHPGIHRDIRADVDGITVCCLINQTKEVTKTSKAVVYAVQAENHERNHTCGFFGMQICTETYTSYRAAPFYKEVQHTEYTQIACPKRNIVCCNGYTRIFGQCISLKQLHGQTVG